MNPEEGELRPQLLDRFGHSVGVERIQAINQRKEIVNLREEFDRDPFGFIQRFQTTQEGLRQRIEEARNLLPKVTISDSLLTKIAQVCIDFAVDGHRADIITTKTVRAIAAFEGREEVVEEDVLEAFEFTLEHRMRRQPFQPVELDRQKLRESIQNKHKDQGEKEEGTEPRNAQPQNLSERSSSPKEEVFEIGNQVKARGILKTKKDRVLRDGSGRGSKVLTRAKQGKYIKSKLPNGKIKDIAIDATIRAAAMRMNKGDEFKVTTEDIREKVRVGECASFITFVVDASGSMGVMDRMKAAKGAILSLLHISYQKRDKVAMLSFREDNAHLLLPPTRSAELALKCLEKLPTGGKTPLPAGILKGMEVIKTELIKNDNLIPVLVLITDGKGNVPIGQDVLEDLARCAGEVKKRKIHPVVIDTEPGPVRLGLAKRFAESCDAKYYHLEELQVGELVSIVQSESKPR
jgi:magnesium chelatase subunit D